jgi:hypothetical protein
MTGSSPPAPASPFRDPRDFSATAADPLSDFEPFDGDDFPAWRFKTLLRGRYSMRRKGLGASSGDGASFGRPVATDQLGKVRKL